MKERTDSGVLIAIEGIDGAGKSTQVALLGKCLPDAVFSKEPTNGPWGRKIRESAARGRMSIEEELRAFIEDRKEHVRDVIMPALAQGKTVVLDRYLYSTAAYQGTRTGNVHALVEEMLTLAPEPDLMLLIDVPPEIGLQRIAERGDVPNAFEKLDNLRRVREGFLALAEKHKNIKVIDGSQSIEAVHRAVIDRLQAVLPRESIRSSIPAAEN